MARWLFKASYARPLVCRLGVIGLLSVLCCVGLMAVAEEASVQDTPEVIRLFDGQTLNGWVVKCKPQDNDKRGYWKVVDGAIMADVPPGSPHNYIWRATERAFAAFDLFVCVLPL
ncbi:MAG TPA: hypothetical protein PL064_05650, partial [Thermogutta sp.]|nr:hypothetical protein [Thermogutta sp.]